MRTLRRLVNLSPTKIAAGYALFGGVWIGLSDALVARLVSSQTLLTQLQTIKGWLFVLLSAMLILGLVEARERQLEQSSRRMERASQELNVLHRIYRHNIRNDLNVVRGYIELCQKSLEERRLRDRLDQAYESTNRILGVSEKLRTIEEANTEARSLDTVDLMGILEGEADRFREAYPEVTLDDDGPTRAVVHADESLAYVFRELLENAVEHFDGPIEECRIRVTVERTMGAFTVEVADNGPGISDYEIGALEGGAESPLVHTSGIGLWLVRWLCLFFDAEVGFESTPEGGTLVTLRFEPASTLDQVLDQAWEELPLQAAA